MWGWSPSRSIAWTSRRARAIAVSPTPPVSNRAIATSRSLSGSRPRKTSFRPPRPRKRLTREGPTRSWTRPIGPVPEMSDGVATASEACSVSGVASTAPQESQNFAPARFSLPQLVHSIAHCHSLPPSMIGTYISAALVCAAALLVGRAVLAILGRREWSWLEPGVGLGALISVAGFFVRAPGHAKTGAVAVVLLLLASLVCLRLPYRYGRALARGLPVALLIVLVSLPYLAASYFTQSAFKETAEVLFVLAFAISLPGLRPFPERPRDRLLALAPQAVICAGIVFSYSIAGLAWPLLTLAIWGLTIPEVRSAVAPRRVLGWLARPVGIGVSVAGVAALLVLGVLGPCSRRGGRDGACHAPPGGRSRPFSSSEPPIPPSSSSAMRRWRRPATAPSCAPSCRRSPASPSSTPGRTASRSTSSAGPTPTCRWSSSPTRRWWSGRPSPLTPVTPIARSTSIPSRPARSIASTTW